MKMGAIIPLWLVLQANPTKPDKKINYEKRQVELLQVFKEIKKQAGFNIIWNEREVDVNRVVNVKFKNADIRAVLEEFTGKLNIAYAIRNRIIILTSKEIILSKNEGL
ncbi:hypothetical protein ABIE26_001183 [Pedobacter africanus]|uniref:Uncharacterized protein n=1 Tax=Pedobacter africanus TaxID=151894 RepID=A0ACC6KST9_9SPHI|nr:STN domain-containing protein [Pedobacter africanus]MDR6782329.1 hypothetical protein [Pedobacter africanus]